MRAWRPIDDASQDKKLFTRSISSYPFPTKANITAQHISPLQKLLVTILSNDEAGRTSKYPFLLNISYNYYKKYKLLNNFQINIMNLVLKVTEVSLL